jgi:hypothetical protein
LWDNSVRDLAEYGVYLQRFSEQEGNEMWDKGLCVRMTFVFVLCQVFIHVCLAQIDFVMHSINNPFNGASSVYATDLDVDGDIDILGGAMDANDIVWWENDGDQQFSEHTIACNFDGASSVYAEDMDCDGDVDVLGAAYNDDEITWWENDGNQQFTEHTIVNDFEGAESVYAIDVDCDGDVDVLGAAWLASDIAWWEGDLIQSFIDPTTAVAAMDEYHLQANYPNPFNSVTSIGFQLPVMAEVTLKVFNVLGREVGVVMDGEVMEAGRHVVRFNGGDLASGVYFYQLQTGDFVEVRKMVLMK